MNLDQRRQQVTTLVIGVSFVPRRRKIHVLCEYEAPLVMEREDVDRENVEFPFQQHVVEIVLPSGNVTVLLSLASTCALPVQPRSVFLFVAVCSDLDSNMNS